MTLENVDEKFGSGNAC